MTTSINKSKYTAHLRPGKFEGESAATEYFYEQMLNGDGDQIFLDIDDEDENYEGPTATIFHVNAEESEAFALACGSWFLLREVLGFAHGSEHDSRDAAEREFNE